MNRVTDIMRNLFSSSQSRKVTITVALIILVIASTIVLIQPKPFQKYVPADSIGYLEFPDLSKVIRFLHERPNVKGVINDPQALRWREWVDSLLIRLKIAEKHLSSIQVGVIFSSATIEQDQTVKLHGVLVVRVLSWWFKGVRQSPQAIAEKMADTHSFISTETLRGKEVAVLTRARPEEQIFITVHRDSVLLSNHRESLSNVLATLDGAYPCLEKSSAWKAAPPQFDKHSLIHGFFVGPSLLNLVRDFLVKNYSAFDDPARTSKFLSSLGFDSVQSIRYSAQEVASGVDELFFHQMAQSTVFLRTPLSIFLNQKCDAMKSIPNNSLLPNALSAKLICATNSEEIWKSFANSLAILTNQEDPKNRDLMIAIIEGALGFRIQRDLLSNLEGSILFLKVESNLSSSPPSGTTLWSDDNSGWIVVFKAKNTAQIENVFSHLISENRRPSSYMVGSAKVLFSSLATRSTNPFKGILEGTPGFVMDDGALYFSSNKEVLISTFRARQQQSPQPTPALPPQFDTRAPFLSFPLSHAPNQPIPGTSKSSGSAYSESYSASEVTPVSGGFQYRRVSPCGLICDLVQAIQGI